ncbi:MAG: enoyl-CoA hydratase-related protein [Pyrinomonadaceae bacterium]|nr:enoyl-CoA hydratase-related protein [Pyrinomonadaceae bacterium]MCX7639792.1 enoyl-CoA hydratase-related protein [Pyrinomonadaceae bacterium]MDW8304375.1 enoyl-CoA hydratase-related protein [Acidobacteriota bacterium]
MKTVELELKGKIAVIKLNRPESLNALSSELIGELHEAISEAISKSVRAIILTGSGRAFCSGGDLREMKAMWEREGRIEAFLEEPLRLLRDLILLIRRTPLPFVAAVNGISAGGGTNLALACDIVIASEDAVFNEAFVKIGLTPDCGGSFFLPRLVGEKRAAELFMLGESVTAQKAFEIGMINRVVKTENLMNEALKLAEKLTQMPTASIGRIKALLNASFANTLEEQIEMENEMQIESGRSADFREGVMAFFEKRLPKFEGR